MSWIESMKKDKVVKEYLLSPEIHAEYVKGQIAGTPNYNIPVWKQLLICQCMLVMNIVNFSNRSEKIIFINY